MENKEISWTAKLLRDLRALEGATSTYGLLESWS